jgi:predicted nucleotidyltransferase
VRPSEALKIHQEAVRRIALQHHVEDVRVFGSVLSGEDTESSDLDLLVIPTSMTTLMDIGAIRYHLQKLLGIQVDVLTPRSLPENFRERVLAEARSV